MKKNIFQKLSDFPLATSASHVYILTEREVGNGESGIFYLRWKVVPVGRKMEEECYIR